MKPIAIECFYAMDAAAAKQTIAESTVDQSVAITDRVTIHHGNRDGVPIVIVEVKDQTAAELAAVWFDESNNERGA